MDLPYRVSDGATTIPRLTPAQLATFIDGRKGGDEVRQLTATFNLHALQSIASQVMGSPCTSVTLIAEGGFNQVFILTFASAVDVIARLHGSSAQQDRGFPTHMITSRFVSEVATLKYLNENTTIPVPKVYGYNSNPGNPVGAIYMLQERMPEDCLGSNVTVLWHHLSLKQREVIVTQIANFEAQLLHLRLPSIGRLFFDNGLGEPDLSHSTRKFKIDSPGYFIGSLGHPIMNDDKFEQQDAGPWTTSANYILAIIKNQLAYVTSYPLECKLNRQKWLALNEEEGDPSDIPYLQEFFLRLFQNVQACLNDPKLRLLSDPNSRHFAIYHPDLTITNIMIAYDDTTRVTGIIDWEGSAILPIWSNPTGQRLVDVSDAAGVALQAIRRKMLYDKVPDYERIVMLAANICLNYLVNIVQYNAVAWMARSQINDLFHGWLLAIKAPYRHYFHSLQEYIEKDKKRGE